MFTGVDICFKVDDEYISVGMNARDAMMSVREELQLITHENDKAYGTSLTFV